MEHLITTKRIYGEQSLTAFSARPDAPVVPYVEPAPRVRRARAAAAGALHRLGDVMAPPSPTCVPQA